MNVAFYTLGCKLNYAETSELSARFEQEGWNVVPFGDSADAVVINTCTVTDNADKECRQVIRRALRTSPEAWVAVTGCYAQLQPEEIASIDGVDAVFGAAAKFDIPSSARNRKVDTVNIDVDELDSDIGFTGAVSAEGDSRTRAFMKLQDGCDYKCSFCTIPKARGASRSMPFADIVPRAQELVQSGYKEIILTGVNLGDYSYDGAAFEDVLLALSDSIPEARFRISSIEPNLVTDKIIDAVANRENVCSHFHIPLQSGSPEILRQMRRRYNRDQYRELVLTTKSRNPHVCIGVDVIAGFPGETQEQFEETYEFLSSLPVSYLHVFKYSQRRDTPAAAMAEQVPGSIKKARVQRLRALSTQKRKEFYASQLGRELSALPESVVDECWQGWTDNYVKVRVPQAMPDIPGFFNVRPTQLIKDHTIAETASPRTVSEASGYIPLMST